MTVGVFTPQNIKGLTIQVTSRTNKITRRRVQQFISP